MSISSQLVTWAFANPILLAFCLFGALLAIFVVVLVSKLKPGPNPFAEDCARPPAPMVADSSARDKVIKQGFTPQKVPKDLDAIVVGSGIGGLAIAAILAKVGKKVLVLEQHDQAGGCCHTFVEKGYEFDVGIHYIGEMAQSTITRLYIDQLTEGQLLWDPIDKNFDTVVIGEGENKKLFPMQSGSKQWFRESLMKMFPEEEAAIEKFIYYMKEQRKHMQTAFLFKILPMRICQLLISTGMASAMTKYFKYSQISLQRFLDGVTENNDLKAVLSYCFGDYGTLPEDASLMMHTLLMNHYVYGGFYPRGGASEIAYHIVPVIEKAGGRVLVRAPVSEILIDRDGAACGVRVARTTGDVDIHAPLIISDAGLVNTYQKLLPLEIVKKHDLMDKFKGTRTALAGFSVFVGLKGSTKDLNLPARQYWSFINNDLNGITKAYANLSAEEAAKSKVPLLFISFPSAKDSTWDERYPGKSACTLVTLANWEWFEEWEKTRMHHRGDEYDAIKKGIADKMWERVLELFPQLEDKVDYFEAGSPLSNRYYLGAPAGEMYGLDHNKERFTAETWTNLRPETPIPNLYLTGQDIMTCGFAGALYAGLMCGTKILNRNLMGDLSTLKAKKKKGE
ncbi:all-trans-retinol 13,14-reductase-like [Strongylocentrotus purpuratus]|uniref:All-trans-retinol 13,14-reductase n=1 Tax=Strongylocentrotus purpuratus TaxID=7668 RepID=A0A7M7N327_STRPU|nr:all-trans-retinol 13,14-reductase-like [Strongylocentrotus purpuratus]